METEERKALQSITDLRIEAAVRCLKVNSQYVGICDRQQKAEARMEKLFQRFEKKDRLFIERYYEDETLKVSLEFDEIYYQGLKDGINVLKFLGVFSQEVNL